jgi:predicted dehydrogenase
MTVVGAGSAGNHMAHAATQNGWLVSMYDIDPKAIQRTITTVYPSRYGLWDGDIIIEEKMTGANVIYIATPPETHCKLAIEAIELKPDLILIEKPLANNLHEVSHLMNSPIPILVGYNHRFRYQDVPRFSKTLSVRFRENWKYILGAHPWLNNPSDSYLGFSKRGGGALFEHSHAINLWQMFAEKSGAGKVKSVFCTQKWHGDCDIASYLHLKTDQGLIGDVIQDCVADPPEKVVVADGIVYDYTRTSTDFLEEVKHLEKVINGFESPISLQYAYETLWIINAAQQSAKSGEWVDIPGHVYHGNGQQSRW